MTTRTQRLVTDAAQAAEIRAYQTHPDVVALRIERVRSQVDRMCWTGIVLGLAFTMTNVQQFASAGTAPWSLAWLAAWVLDPTVSLVLLAILRAEQVTARYRVRTGPWVRRAKWFTLAATYVMNTWESYASGEPAAIVLHSVPPLVVFVAAEAITEVRDRLSEAVVAAHAEAQQHGPAVSAVSTVDRAVHEGAASQPRPKPRRRKLFAAYLVDARAAWTPDVVVTAAWVRRVTGCSRGLSPRLARALSAELDGGERP
ncbi:hypothetical protein EV193_112129 [Herbihabitans rhizosphaerae]|uniref:DUF2637 domain-containing protein n=1 Tax=Herbihabitans rhizosphaerae TaxID=1872711 RepID=A0A4Q7KE30_9PSEU|nr:hypothetical protein [Herbihabitans rhizosphaerae]RZS32495.1 hypothetical protein EV193_112129 [Herbihabitans rhizosphaerae]